MKLSLIFTAALVLATAAFSREKNPVPLDGLGKLAILDGGRIKPLDSYARHSLLQLSARSTFHGEPAIEWLARLMFTPKMAMEDDVFRINNEEVAYALGIEPEENHRYSFAQLSPNINKLSDLADAAMKVEEKKRSPTEGELIRVANGLSLYLGLMNSFLFCVPQPDFRVSDSGAAGMMGLEIREKPYSYLDLRTALRKAGAGNETAGSLFPLSQRFQNWTRHYRDFPIHLFPPMEKGEKMWLSAWGLAALEHPDPKVDAAVIALEKMVAAYGSANATGFSLALNQVQGFVEEYRGRLFSPHKIEWELAYNRLNPFYLAKIFYGFSALGALLALMFFAKWLRPLASLLLGLGVLSQAVGLGLRIAVSGRPPVTNLFETFVFVAWIGALLGLVLEFFSRKGFGTMVGAITGFSVLLLSMKYSADGDTLGVLVAVLNSNFWLTTHVITISLGYAGCCLAGVLGHLYLIHAAIRSGDKEKLDSLSQMTYAVLAFGLIFSFIGTILGGVWADQSWGRFWGWDPKENGALMIVLWGTILFHAKVGKMIGPVGMAVGSVLGIIVVMMAWFGINLLGVGLHSYGFTSGVANALGAYVAAEILFLTITVYLVQRANRLPRP